jgi:hypothetical protein
MTNPDRSSSTTRRRVATCSDPLLEPHPASTTAAALASTQRQSEQPPPPAVGTQCCPPTKRSKVVQPKSGYNLKDFIQNPIVQANAALIDEIVQLSKNEDTTPFIFFWDAQILRAFLQNMVQVAAADDVEIPPQLQPAVFAGIGPGDDSSGKVLAKCILDYLQSRIEGIVRLSMDHAGFVCNYLQLATMIIELVALDKEPWFAAVLAVGPLGGPLAQYFITRPRSRTGVIDRVAGSGPLWSWTNSTSQETEN